MQPLVINPKSVTLSELYGAYDLSTFEWADGILSTLFKQSAESDKPDEKVRILHPFSSAKSRLSAEDIVETC